MKGQKQVGICQKFKNAVKIKWFNFKEINKVISDPEVDLNLETDLDTSNETESDPLLETKGDEEVELENISPELRLKNSPYIQHKRFSLSTLDSMVSLTSHAVKHIPKIAHHLYRELWLDFHNNNDFIYDGEIIVRENDDTGKTTEFLDSEDSIDEREQEECLEEGEQNMYIVSGNELGLEVNDAEYIVNEEEEEINPVFLMEDETLRSREMVFNFRRLSDEFSNSIDSSETLGETSFNGISDLGSFESDATMVNHTANSVPFSIGWFINRSDGLNTLINFVVGNEQPSLETSEDEADLLSLHSNSQDTATTNAGILDLSSEDDYAQNENEKLLVVASQFSNHPDLYDNCEESFQLMKNSCQNEFFNMRQDEKSSRCVGTDSGDSLELVDLNVKVYIEGNSNTEEKKGQNCITDLLDDYM